jgi:hypothetical protein
MAEIHRRIDAFELENNCLANILKFVEPRDRCARLCLLAFLALEL